MAENVMQFEEATFASEVEQGEGMVVVDFWAPWCGPCRMLGPILERLANEPNSGFLLAKLNTDQNQMIASQYNIRGIPAVKAFRDGQVVDEFVGAQPEPMVRQFIQRVTAGAARRQASSAAQPQRRARPSGNAEERLEQARQLLQQGNGCEAARFLKDFPSGAHASVANQMLPLADFLCSTPQTGNSAVDNLFSQAVSALRRREYNAALYQLLSARNQASPSDKSQVQQVMQGIFALLGDTDPIVAQYKSLV